MNSHPASSIARATGGYAVQTLALIAVVARMPRLASAAWSRQKPTRIP